MGVSDIVDDAKDLVYCTAVGERCPNVGESN
jgi:hypothetical protein